MQVDDAQQLLRSALLDGNSSVKAYVAACSNGRASARAPNDTLPLLLLGGTSGQPLDVSLNHSRSGVCTRDLLVSHYNALQVAASGSLAASYLAGTQSGGPALVPSSVLVLLAPGGLFRGCNCSRAAYGEGNPLWGQPGVVWVDGQKTGSDAAAVAAAVIDRASSMLWGLGPVSGVNASGEGASGSGTLAGERGGGRGRLRWPLARA